MSPIPVHTSSPINTNLPSYPLGASPSTAASRYAPGGSDAGPTTAAPSSTSMPPARPGAPAMPQPTNAVSSTYNHRFQPTATAPVATKTSGLSDGPPPPQPGAVPSPFSATREPTIPQPPQPGGVPQWTPSSASPIRHTLPSPTPTHSRPLPLPAHQQSATIYDPARSVPPAGVTSTYTRDLSHPPGYVQDSRASFDDKPVESCQPFENRVSPSSSHRGGILDGEPTLDRGAEAEPNVLNTAIAWAKAAGKKLSKAEEQAWKTINGAGSN